MQSHDAHNETVYRPFEERDLPYLAEIVAGVWYDDAPDDLRPLAGTVDFAVFAKRATYACVAEMNGHAVGVALARAHEADEANIERWSSTASDALERIAAINPSSADVLRKELEEEARIDAELLAESGEDPDFELVLFAVSPETRGHGVGTELLGRAERYLVSAGAHSMFLFTDTSCTWEYYERRGMRRSAERAIELPGAFEDDGPEDAASPKAAFEMYVYATDLP